MVPLRRRMAEIKGKINAEMVAQIKTEVNVPLGMQDFLEALQNTCRSVSNDDLAKY